MSNKNPWQLEELPNSKIIITEKVYNRLMLLIGRAAWISSEHSSTLFGRKIDGSDVWIIDEVNANEDYVSKGTNSINPSEYYVSSGKEQSKEIVRKLKSKPGTVVIDVHTHPSGLIDDYRFYSRGDLDSYKEYSQYVSDLGGTFFAGLIGVDRLNGNMSFSIIWYNKLNDEFYRVENIYLRRMLENGEYRDFPFSKYGKTQLIMQTWADQDAKMDQKSVEELRGFENR